MKAEAAKRTLGRRGAYLLILGITWVLSGLLDIVAHPKPFPGAWLYTHTPWQVQAAGWIGTGLVCCWAAFQKQGRDAIGWVSAYVMAVFAAVVYIDLVFESIGSPTLLEAFLSGARNYGILALLFVPSGWREPVTFTGDIRGSQTGHDD